tara:strand:- start:226 stop:495 length:270 start_codon:yes stop_codon:yes gene_type:complete
MLKEPVYDEDKAMNNIYLVLTNSKNNAEEINTIIEATINSTDDSYIYYPFDPNNYNEEDINTVLTYFSNKDEFEKCIKLMECCSIKTKK